MIRSFNFLEFVDYPDSWLSSGIFALVKRASGHRKGTMEIDSTGIIAFDGVKCKYGALECRDSQASSAGRVDAYEGSK